MFEILTANRKRRDPCSVRNQSQMYSDCNLSRGSNVSRVCSLTIAEVQSFTDSTVHLKNESIFINVTFLKLGKDCIRFHAPFAIEVNEIGMYKTVVISAITP
jgi:hypothetical protein